MVLLTMSEKVLARAAGVVAGSVRAGDIVTAKVDLVMSHDNAALIGSVFRGIPVRTVFDRQRMVMVLDHRTPAPDIETASKQKLVRDFVKEQEIPTFYDMREGICHQVLPEKGHVLPGMHIVGTDSHSCTYGALGAFGYGIGATEMAAVWASGDLWVRIPETLRIRIDGRLPRGVFAKDVTLEVIRDVRADGAGHGAIEYEGSWVDASIVPERQTLCNMGIEMGAQVAMVPPDATTLAYLAARGKRDLPLLVRSDPGARVRETREFDVSRMEPRVACPHSVDNVYPVTSVVGRTIHQAFLGSCTNGRVEDLREAARVLKGRQVHADVRLIVTPASRTQMLDSMADGTLETLIRAGAIVGTPGCGPCMGAAGGILAPGERCVSSSNRNFKGRMGSPQAEVYLASPATVAASAVEGVLADPRKYL